MPPSEIATRSFEAVTRLAAVSDGVFTAHISPEWTIGGRPNGGYLLSLLGRAATAVTTHRHVIAAARTTSARRIRGPPRSALRCCARGAPRARCGCDSNRNRRARRRSSPWPTWTRQRRRTGAGASRTRAMSRSTTRCRSTGCCPTASGSRSWSRSTCGSTPHPSASRPAGRVAGASCAAGCHSPAAHRLTRSLLLFAVDAFPPATFDVELSGWVPTFELTVYVRALPAPGPVRILQRAQLIDGQRLDETCFVWDRTGRLVAHGTQLAGIRLG